MKKRLLFLIAGIVAAVMPMSAVSFYYKYNDQNLKFTIIDEEAKTCMLAQYDLFGSLSLKKAPHDLKGDLVLPEIAVRSNGSEYRVVEIGEMSFRANAITSVVIPNSVKKIGKSAFAACLLESVTLPEDLAEIPDEAFAHCLYLSKINIPGTITSIGGSAFEQCISLKSFDMPESLQTIGSMAFDGCRGIKHVDLPESLTTLGYGAFMNSGLESITIPGSVTTLERNIFSGCENLTSAILPESMTSIPESIFNYCRKLNSVVMPKHANAIAAEAFRHCESLTSIDFPDGLVSIGSNAFDSCAKLEGIDLPNSVSKIGKSAFFCCDLIKTVKLPESLKILSDFAFTSCTSLKSITFPQGIDSIGASALLNTAITSLEIPESVQRIGQKAFAECSALSAIYYAAESPLGFNANLFSPSTFANAKLNVTDQAAEKCGTLAPWYKFETIDTYNPTDAAVYKPLLEEGKSWIIGKTIRNGGSMSNSAQMPRYQLVYQYDVIGDTVVENTPCKVVAYYRSDLKNRIKFILHEENGIVSMYNKNFYKQPFIQVFDFNAVPGKELYGYAYDMIEPFWDYDYNTYIPTFATFAKGSDGVARKEIVFSNSSWVEGIGASHDNWMTFQSIFPSCTEYAVGEYMIECRKDAIVR